MNEEMKEVLANEIYAQVEAKFFTGIDMYNTDVLTIYSNHKERELAHPGFLDDETYTEYNYDVYVSKKSDLTADHNFIIDVEFNKDYHVDLEQYIYEMVEFWLGKESESKAA